MAANQNHIMRKSRADIVWETVSTVNSKIHYLPMSYETEVFLFTNPILLPVDTLY
jgi:hypothetical protein